MRSVAPIANSDASVVNVALGDASLTLSRLVQDQYALTLLNLPQHKNIHLRHPAPSIYLGILLKETMKSYEGK
ncbi:uncharacterized protein MONOS_3995 [Monocercomonoides exilis]|uniref:uncharacterized protein n=1 Tax=Monocercomonoides exilis TaxID=2049356 RepID=UPI00355983A6|nr:hypothetical protein MONOS_3995 [Monocercomonoides exilis]|eukprot:MONOS_3995.1-p1 / transcript=MONOS_3995.1 / gene=MONOS_3995 / organism=Monocercomonoides_exilis_PA203 / gene_product=unspecified product / transcript_product=unspecified product / location=Mono_scaffold00100:72552-72770(+) / protein_length=73 / sequence_SO=supercontig / SO=protein_coding / is_pseudo=false